MIYDAQKPTISRARTVQLARHFLEKYRDPRLTATEFEVFVQREVELTLKQARGIGRKVVA